MACTVFKIDPLVEQEFLCLVGAFKDELGPSRFSDAVLHGSQLDIEYQSQMMFLQSAKDDDLIDAVHELGREFPFGRLERCPIDLGIDLVVLFDSIGLCRCKSDTTRYHV